MKTDPFIPQSPPPANTPTSFWKTSLPHLERAKLRDLQWKDYALRFLFGGSVSVLAALLGHWVTLRFGGLFTAFPAILLASLTLIGKKEGREPSAEDAQGGVVGAIALVGTAVFIALTLQVLAGAISLLGGLLLWLLLSLGLYLLGVKIGWLRTTPNEEHTGSASSTSHLDE